MREGGGEAKVKNNEAPTRRDRKEDKATVEEDEVEGQPNSNDGQLVIGDMDNILPLFTTCPKPQKKQSAPASPSRRF